MWCVSLCEGWVTVKASNKCCAAFHNPQNNFREVIEWTVRYLRRRGTNGVFIENFKIFAGPARYSKGRLLFMAVEMQFKTRVSTLAVCICIIHTETRQIPRSFHYNPIPRNAFHGKLNGVREMFTVSVTFYSPRRRNVEMLYRKSVSRISCRI